ncbi:DUF1648 domain-containing protein [Paenibacillus sp. IHBB 10380]|uniref:DUF1648 domain-containing protein n=1 Tax=Paenibacillus sp. IHBB 10380 TaxID=1566358 RepID=UPI0005CF9337|nr:DUF5808 domain-containing protein [Paenibacillus sp. IHBB 10380]AJS61296.1 hypothetical protein UB51_25875 [Paenibacillus sp. IHBB 10380]
MYWLSMLMLFLMFISTSVVLISMPYLTSERDSFGVSISQDMYYSDELSTMRKKYVWISSIVYSILLLFCLVSISLITNAGQQGTLIIVYVVCLVTCSTIINVIFHLKMKKYKSAFPSVPLQKTILAIDTAFRRHKLIFSNKWFLIHFAIIIANIALVLLNYNRFPEILPMKFDFNGQVTRSVYKSYRTLLGLNCMQIVMTLLFMFINWSILKSKQQINANDPQKSIHQNTTFRRRWSLFIILTGLLIVLLFSFIQLNMMFLLNIEILFIVSISIVSMILIGSLLLSFTTGQGGSRVGGRITPSNVEPTNNDAYWKFWGIYFNPHDPSLFIEKRMGIGWTINFARPMSWFLLLGILAIVIGTALLVS